MKLIIFLLITLPLSASNLSHTVATTTNSLDATWTINLPRLPQTFGKLTNVVIKAEWTVTRTNHVESFSYIPFDYSLDHVIEVKLLFPDNSVCAEKTHSGWTAGNLDSVGATDDTNGKITNFLNTHTCNGGFAPARADWIGSGTMPFHLVMDSTVTLTTVPTGAELFATNESYGYGSVTVTYQYTTGTGSAFPCH